MDAVLFSFAGVTEKFALLKCVSLSFVVGHYWDKIGIDCSHTLPPPQNNIIKSVQLGPRVAGSLNSCQV